MRLVDLLSLHGFARDFDFQVTARDCYSDLTLKHIGQRPCRNNCTLPFAPGIQACLLSVGGLGHEQVIADGPAQGLCHGLYAPRTRYRHCWKIGHVLAGIVLYKIIHQHNQAWVMADKHDVLAFRTVLLNCKRNWWRSPRRYCLR